MIYFNRPNCFSKRNRFYAINIILLLGLVVIGCTDSPTGNGASSEIDLSSKQIPVEVMQAEIGDAASYYVTTATLSPKSDASINARTAGVVRKILHEEGDDVSAGELLLILEDEDQKLRLKQAEQRLTSAEREYKRLNKMKDAGVLSPTEWEATNNTYLTAKIDVELAELALSYTQVTAPFAGRIVWRDVDWGAYVANGSLLFRIMAIKPLLAKVHVPANRIEKIAAGQLVRISVASSSTPLQGIVEMVSPIVDPTSGTVKVTVRLESYPVSVRPGDFAEVSMITNKRKDALLLPSVAIIEERGQHHIFIDDQGKALRKKIEIGYVIGDQTEILSGISAQDRVVFKGQRNLNDGNPLNIINNNLSAEPESSDNAITEVKSENALPAVKKSKGSAL